jgi:hypothetical protein
MSFLKTIWNTWWLQWTWPLKIGSIILVIVIFGLVFGWLKSCSTKTPKLDETEIQKGEQAVKEQNDEELRKILTNSDVKNILADDTNSKVEAVNAIHESQKKWDNANRDELQAEFDRRKGQ